nr:AI-2E family transporter [Pelotalea chapellei]
MVAFLALLWYAVDMLLLGFAGVLLAVLLRAPANWLARHSPFSAGWSLLVVILALALLLGIAAWLVATPVLEQFSTLTNMLPDMADSALKQLHHYTWGDWVVGRVESLDWKSPRINLLGKMTGALSSVFGIFADIIIILFLGLYLAAQPETYINGIIKLVPISGRQRARQVLEQIGSTLQWWLLGILTAMSIIGILSGLGLWLMGIPFALALGLLAGLLAFIPYLGAIISAIPAMLVALALGPEHALYVAALYFGIHLVEGYLLNPLIQQYAVSLPAAVLLSAQVLFGILLGGMGIILAAPIAATILVAVKMLYIEDLLGESGNTA